MPSNHLILGHPLLLLPSVFPSIRVFSNESALLIRWPKCWSFIFSMSPSSEYSGLISFRMGCLDLLAVQVLSRVFSSTTVQKHQFFGPQPLWSNYHICTWLLVKTIALAAKTGCDSLPPPPCHWTTHALGAWNTACPMAALYRNSPYFWVVDVFSPKSFKQHQIFYKSLSWNIAEA